VRLGLSAVSRKPSAKAVWLKRIEAGRVFALSLSAYEQTADATVLNVEHSDRIVLIGLVLVGREGGEVILRFPEGSTCGGFGESL
jgi:hypothetical protein